MRVFKYGLICAPFGIAFLMKMPLLIVIAVIALVFACVQFCQRNSVFAFHQMSPSPGLGAADGPAPLRKGVSEAPRDVMRGSPGRLYELAGQAEKVLADGDAIAMAKWIDALSQEELIEIFLAFVREEWKLNNSRFSDLLFAQIGRKCGSTLTSEFEEASRTDNRVRQCALAAFSRGFASSGLEDAFLALRRLREESAKRRLGGGIGWALLQHDGTESLAWMSSHAELANQFEIFAPQYALKWLFSDDASSPQLKVDSILACEMPKGLRDAILNNWAHLQTVRDPEDFMLQFKALGKRAENLPPSTMLFFLDHAKDVPASRLLSFLENTDAQGFPGASEAYQKLGLMIAKRDPDSMASLHSALHNSARYDDCIAGFVRGIWNVDRVSAEKWLASISSEKWRSVATGNPVKNPQ